MLYRIFRKIPILKTIAKIINVYVFEGDPRARNKSAPVGLWIKSIGIPLFAACALATLTLYKFISFPDFYLLNGSFDVRAFENFIKALTPSINEIEKPFNSPGTLLTSIFPNLLGFGIGVYALIFALAPESLQLLQNHIASNIRAGKRKHGSALMLNASMAFPLVVISIAVIIGIFQQLFEESKPLIFFTWLIFWYGIVVLIELIGVLFALGEQDALDKIT